jgi:hypothetical protein
MAIWMYVIRELEHAIYLCETGDCDEESCLGKGAVHEVDEAYAFFAGSLAPDGVLTYNLAETLASEFGTGSDGAQVNADLLEAFDSAKEAVVGAECAELRTHTTKIVQLMSIPLVQGTLAYTAAGTATGRQEDEGAERAIFAASVLPLVANCSMEDAEVIYENTKAGASGVNLAAVEEAFANNYDCMGITAGDVGEFSGSSGNGTDGGTDGGGTSTSGAAQAGWILGVISLFYGML